jgi:hypothetical protein
MRPQVWRKSVVDARQSILRGISFLAQLSHCVRHSFGLAQWSVLIALKLLTAVHIDRLVAPLAMRSIYSPVREGT